jgi:hypothetical protein
MRRRLLALTGGLLLMSVACGPAEEPAARLNELAKVRSGDLDVVLLSAESAVSTGRDTLTLEFRAPDGRLVDVGTVRGHAMMPMAGASPMFGPVDVQPTDTPGRYLAASELTMAGDWRLTVEWTGPRGSGSASFSTQVQ